MIRCSESVLSVSESTNSRLIALREGRLRWSAAAAATTTTDEGAGVSFGFVSATAEIRTKQRILLLAENGKFLTERQQN